MIMAATTLTDRAVVRLSGEDVRGFLQSLVTSDLTGALPVWAGLLTPQGKCLFDFLVWSDGDDLLLDCEGDASDDLIKRLSIYRLRRPITIARDPSLAVHWSLEPGLGVPDPRLPELVWRWLSRALRKRAPGRCPSPPPWVARRKSGTRCRASCRGWSYARRSGCRPRAAWCAPAARVPERHRYCGCRCRPAGRRYRPATPR